MQAPNQAVHIIQHVLAKHVLVLNRAVPNILQAQVPINQATLHTTLHALATHAQAPNQAVLRIILHVLATHAQAPNHQVYSYPHASALHVPNQVPQSQAHHVNA